MSQLYAVPSWLLLFVAMGIAAALACAGLIMVRRRFGAFNFGEHNAVAGPMLGIVGGIYAVMLAFVTITVWQEYDGSQQRLAAEGSAAGDVWRAAVGLSPAATRALRGEIVGYAQVLVAEEWPLMRRGEMSRRAELRLAALYAAAARLRPADAGETNAQLAILQAIATLHDARRHRLLDNASGVSGFQWGVLVIGSLAVFSYCYLMGMSNVRAHLIMVAALAVVVASMFVLIFELDYPFRGDLAIPPRPIAEFLTWVRLAPG
ncbi:MAG TPA: DUF4239 domain-containing protein [Candidatus Limnocylindria bacterium]|nr:DUF4239 domain-containing protein [Candidatus Limnocylindria bacterium]